MEQILPNNRFDTHLKSKETPAHLIYKAIASYGISFNDCFVTKLTRGFANANYLVSFQKQKAVIRIYSGNQEVAEREADLLRFLEGKPIKVPRILKEFLVKGRPVAFLEYIEGITLEEQLMASKRTSHLFKDVGRQLALIHEVRFKESGFIGPKLKLKAHFADFGEYVREYITNLLNEISEVKLSKNINSRIRKLIEGEWDRVLEMNPISQLCHCDFNPKNIIVSAEENIVKAIIDWEFCLAGNGLIDLGNFFRFEYDYPDGAKEAFIDGYRSIHSSLPENWEDIARLLDLAAMCEFLGRDSYYQKTIRTARTVVEATLDYFGY